jgi:hypothetical protein
MPGLVPGICGSTQSGRKISAGGQGAQMQHVEAHQNGENNHLASKSLKNKIKI